MNKGIGKKIQYCSGKSTKSDDILLCAAVYLKSISKVLRMTPSRQFLEII